MLYAKSCLVLGALGALMGMGPLVAKDGAGASSESWLAAHNAARSEFGSAPLAWNEDLAQEAEGWAQRIALDGRMRHASMRRRRGQGENLWMGTRGHYAPRQIIAGFIGEKRHFRPGTFPHVSRTGRWSDVAHYTQIVWPRTREVGCALASGRRFDVLVCRYWPAGNTIGTHIAPKEKLAKR